LIKSIFIPAGAIAPGCSTTVLILASRHLDIAENLLQTNPVGALNCTKAILPTMIRQGAGWIVYISSIAGRIGVPDESVYAASQFALTGFSEALSMEVEDYGIHVTTVFPLVVKTPFFSARAYRRLPPNTFKKMIPPQDLPQQILLGLQRGERKITVPRRYRLIYGIKALWPGFFRAQTKREVIDHLQQIGSAEVSTASPEEARADSVRSF
jgi:short-subunit dehydrogenase